MSEWAEWERRFCAASPEVTPKQARARFQLAALAHAVSSASHAVRLQREADEAAAKARRWNEQAAESLAELTEYMAAWDGVQGRDPSSAAERLVRSLARRLADEQAAAGGQWLDPDEFVRREIMSMQRDER